jgi:alkylation response protein AidB-like acyl-CoA dehydrogenase
MDFTESLEHHDLRKAVAAVTQQYGPDYFAKRAVAGEPTTELWHDLGRHGFIGISIPEQYGGGGAGMVELAIVCD